MGADRPRLLVHINTGVSGYLSDWPFRKSMKTIRQIATECGVSEQAVRAWCRRNNVAKDAKGSFAIDESIKTAIYQHYRVVEGNEVSQPAKASCETCETSERVLISMLQKELDLKSDKQIEELNARLAESNAALVAAQQTAQAAQALHAGTIQQQLAGESSEQETHEPEERKSWLRRIFNR